MIVDLEGRAGSASSVAVTETTGQSPKVEAAPLPVIRCPTMIRCPDDSNLTIEEYTELHNDAQIVTLSRRSRLKNLSAIKVAAMVRHSHWAVQCASIWFAAFLTHAYANQGPRVGGNLAQATVVILGCQVAPQLGAPLAMGAYLGTASKAIIPNLMWLALMSLIGSGSWCLVSHYKLFVGFGGRIGLTSFCTCHVVQLVFAMPSGAVAWSAYGELWHTTLCWQKVVATVCSPIVSAILSKFLRCAGGSLENPVVGASTVALLCFVSLSATGWVYADDVMDGVGVGSFVGMASTELLPTYLEFGIAGLLAGGASVLLDPFCNGWAGKQGTCAFLGFCATICGRKLCWAKAEEMNEASSK